MGLLIVDLGRPMRFLHMLRVFKLTSPLSVSSYILSPFSALTVATGLHALPWFPALRAMKLARWIPGLRKGAAAGSAVFGGPMTTYTAVLLANTASPSWHEPHEELPFLFAGSAMAAGGGVTMALTPLAPVAEAAVAAGGRGRGDDRTGRRAQDRARARDRQRAVHHRPGGHAASGGGGPRRYGHPLNQRT